MRRPVLGLLLGHLGQHHPEGGIGGRPGRRVLTGGSQLAPVSQGSSLQAGRISSRGKVRFAEPRDWSLHEL